MATHRTVPKQQAAAAAGGRGYCLAALTTAVNQATSAFFLICRNVSMIFLLSFSPNTPRTP